jgi:hypothetical protein
MKRRTRRTLNFLAFNLLFFSLYLNFIHKDKDNSVDPTLVQNNAATYKATNAATPVVNAQPVEKNVETVKTIN